MAVGIHRAGLPGALIAWFAFTAPSAILMVMFASVAGQIDIREAAWLHGLKLTAVVIVAQAVWSMGKSFCIGLPRLAIGIAAAAICLSITAAWSQLLAIGLGGVAGLFLPRPNESQSIRSGTFTAYGQNWAIAALVAFAVLLLGLPLLTASVESHSIALIDSFYRSGSLVFGGGHVVLPLLQQEIVPRGWLSNDSFLAGYGATQAVPGPLFTFAAFLGAAMPMSPSGILGALLCTVAIFLPSLLLVTGALPFWNRVSQQPRMRTTLQGVNAAVVGILLAALYNPIITGSIHNVADALIAVAMLVLMLVFNFPSWVIVALCTTAAIGVHYLH
jgi:chromate transporter